MPMAMGRSKLGPSFFTSAGARFTVVRPCGQKYPLFATAVVTRSRLSFTATSGNPTTTTSVFTEGAVFTSISTSYASTPMTAAEKTCANIPAPQSPKTCPRYKS
jgi:hypothetical protein